MQQNRNTKQKKIILSIAQSRCDHPTADRIYLEARAIDNKISRGTVYRNLEQLSEMGALLRVKVPGADRFDSRADNHYHMICRKCGNVFDAPIEYCREIDRQVCEISGFTVEYHNTVFEGICRSCKQADEENKGNNTGIVSCK